MALTMKDLVEAAKKRRNAQADVPKLTLPSLPFAKGLPQTRRKEIEQLSQIEKKAFSSRKRYRERPYLAAVYQLYRD